MILRRSRRFVWCAVLAACAVVALGFVVVQRNAAGQPSLPESPLKTVSAVALSQTGLRLQAVSPGDAGEVLVTGADAEALASERGGTEIREIMLAQVETFLDGADFHCICWVVSTRPEEGLMVLGPMPNAGDEQPAPDEAVRQPFWPEGAFHLEFIDARTGERLFGVEGS